MSFASPAVTGSDGLWARLRSISERDGPFVSLYLDTEAGTETGARDLELRWRALRERAESHGARERALGALDGLVDGAQTRGDGLAAITSGDEVVFRRWLPRRIGDGVRVGPLPHLLPLIEWHGDNPRYAVVVADRVGAEIHVLGGLDAERTETVAGDDWPLTKVRSGGMAEPRIQRRAENNWEGNAKEVASELTGIVDAEDIDLVVVAGDVRAIGFLQEQLGHDQETIAVEIDSRPTVSLDDIVDDLDGVVAAYSGQTTEDLLATFREERGQGDLAADGVEPTLAALRKAQVDTLLLAREVSGGDVWFSASNRAQVARDRTTLTDLGHDDATAGPLSDVLVCAALASGAQVRALPDLSAEHGPSEGVGALLRFRTSG